MPEPTNEDRAEWARIGLDAFAAETGVDSEDLETQISDLVADLMHLADLERVDWDRIYNRVLIHYEAEIAEQGRATSDPRAWRPGRPPRRPRRRRGR